jgi:DNA-binding CsgD family transcriptional regulator
VRLRPPADPGTPADLDEVYVAAGPIRRSRRAEPCRARLALGCTLALHHLGRGDEAQGLVSEEITLARRWRAPTTLGRALRVAGLIQGGQEELRLLREATTVLVGSPGRLEYAKALIDMGAALRRSGRPDALTPSERRVAEFAAAGYSNCDIAQALFITTNTVEVHLITTYRKLGVNSRANLTSVSLNPT